MTMFVGIGSIVLAVLFAGAENYIAALVVFFVGGIATAISYGASGVHRAERRVAEDRELARGAERRARAEAHELLDVLDAGAQRAAENERYMRSVTQADIDAMRRNASRKE